MVAPAVRRPTEIIASLVAAVLFTVVAVTATGCRQPPSPASNPDQFASLLRMVAADARTEGDSTALYLRNDENDRIRRRMLNLRVDFVRYDRRKGLVCMWRGGGMSRARGFAHPLPGARTVPLDSVGERCYRTGPCSETRIDSVWTGWECP